MRTTTRRARLLRRASYWVDRLDLALARGDLATAAVAQERLRVLGWVVAPCSAWDGRDLDPEDLAVDLAAELDHEHGPGDDESVRS